MGEAERKRRGPNDCRCSRTSWSAVRGAIAARRPSFSLTSANLLTTPEDGLSAACDECRVYWRMAAAQCGARSRGGAVRSQGGVRHTSWIVETFEKTESLLLARFQDRPPTDEEVVLLKAAGASPISSFRTAAPESYNDSRARVRMFLTCVAPHVPPRAVGKLRPFRIAAISRRLLPSAWSGWMTGRTLAAKRSATAFMPSTPFAWTSAIFGFQA